MKMDMKREKDFPMKRISVTGGVEDKIREKRLAAVLMA